LATSSGTGARGVTQPRSCNAVEAATSPIKETVLMNVIKRWDVHQAESFGNLGHFRIRFWDDSIRICTHFMNLSTA
jgi:hypothetical protein